MALAPALPVIEGDNGQLEQVLMNLLVNAQDAMPDGGRLTIETALVELDEHYAAQHDGVTPGSYVMLAMTDTGHGMDQHTRENLFEPFFTTREQHKGTGLGLATVYGIIKQHGGNIWVYSEAGMGATFKVYLPVSDKTDAGEEKQTADTTLAFSGKETILLVEDNPQVRKLARTILIRQGYYVLCAENGPEALVLLENADTPPDLLLTDVIMPEMNGKQLFKKLAALYPDLRVVYMSGYTDNVIGRHGIIDNGINFIEKPFSVKTLTTKIHRALHQ
jgi:CheY-like chemotaxis protein